MRRSLVVAGVSCIVMLLVVGCGKQPAGQGAQPAKSGGAAGTKAPTPPAPAAADTVQSEKDAMVAGIGKALDNLDKEIQALAARAEAKGGQAKADWDQKVKPQLDKDIAGVKAALDKAKSAADADWAKAKDSVTAAMGRLMDAYNKEHRALTTSAPAPSAPAKPATEAGGTSK